MKGMRAAKTLLQGTKLVSSSGRQHFYKKIGGLSEAIKDFESVSDFKDLKSNKYWLGMRVQIGDREIAIQKRGWLESPTISIVLKGKALDSSVTIENIDTIYYKQWFPRKFQTELV